MVKHSPLNPESASPLREGSTLKFTVVLHQWGLQELKLEFV